MARRSAPHPGGKRARGSRPNGFGRQPHREQQVLNRPPSWRSLSRHRFRLAIAGLVFRGRL
eukprot:11156779-Lingulodinium_polyedra.AAC.1